MQTRYEERRKKRRQNLILNSLIAIVFIFIVIVGAQLVSNPSTQTKTSGNPDNHEPLAKEKDHENEETAYEEDDGEANDENTDESEEDQAREENGYRFVGGGPDGPWEPIGTKQTGEHVLQFKRGTLDWEEMELALAYAAGIDHDKMTVIWLGNGGAPNRAKGQVKSNDQPNVVYHVLLEWIDGQGWKPIEVEIEQ